MQQFIKTAVRSVVLFIAPFMVVGCGAAPVPTLDQKALEATITARLIATQTANAPTSTSTPVTTPTPVVNATPDVLSRIPPKKNYQHNYKIDVKYDNVRDSTTIVMSPPSYDISGTPNSLLADYVLSGNKTGVPQEVAVSFISSSESWQYLGTSSIDWLIDGSKRFSLKGQHDGKVGSGYVTEYVLGQMPTAQFLDIVNASKVEVAIASFHFSLTDTQFEALKDFASRMNP